MARFFARPAQHIVYDPAYVSKYPPGQGLLLAVGQVLTGEPRWGIWFSIGILAVSVHWMMLAWVSPRWAWVAGGLTILQFGFAHHWAQSLMSYGQILWTT
jgi:hypothetical protein